MGNASAEFRFRGWCDYIRNTDCGRRFFESSVNYVGGMVTDYCTYDRYKGGIDWEGTEELLNVVMVSMPTDYTQAAVYKDGIDQGVSFVLRDDDDGPIFPVKSGDVRIGLQFENAYLGEVLMYGRALTDDERSQVFEYLMHKYQI